MEERTTRKIKKELHFKNSGETYSVEICLENISPQISTDTNLSFLNELFERIKKELLVNQTSINKLLDKLFGIIRIFT